MGSCGSKTKTEDVKLVENPSFKVLLLGAGESGKSTVVKQLKSIYKIEIDEQELLNYKTTIHHNTLTSMQVFIEAAERFNLEFENETEKEFAKTVKDFNLEGKIRFLPPNLAEAISQLWKTTTIQKSFARRSEFWNLDSADYYFANVERFAEENYVPNEDDRIMARVRTTGIVSTEFDETGVHFSVFDVAGQRSERKKWLNCFENVKAVVFVVSLAGYNQVMFEDSTHNKMQEELNLFQTIGNNPLFAEVPIFLFLNKKDLFQTMIGQSDLSKCFPEYKGGSDIQEAMKYVQAEFEKRMSDKKRLSVHFIAARYKKDIKYTWEEIRDDLLDFYKMRTKQQRRKTTSVNRGSLKA